ncbi:MAG: hypothetical protein MMC23_003426 [Stictis urceolatum]|nr:hypothetical protein [Stictis urceolata]
MEYPTCGCPVPPNRTTTLPYWLVNVPPNQRPKKCPDYLRDLSDKDRFIIATRDEDFHELSWHEVKQLVARKDFAALKRRPSQLRLYRWFVYMLKEEYGSVFNFILQKRLKWQRDLAPDSSTPLECEDDYAVLYNDCPYGIDGRIVHLVVWTKVSFASDAATGELTSEAQGQIEAFVRKRFLVNMEKPERVLWFKNPPALRSVHAIDHFHIMLFEPDATFLEQVTKGDVAQQITPGKSYGNGFEGPYAGVDAHSEDSERTF